MPPIAPAAPVWGAPAPGQYPAQYLGPYPGQQPGQYPGQSSGHNLGQVPGQYFGYPPADLGPKAKKRPVIPIVAAIVVVVALIGAYFVVDKSGRQQSGAGPTTAMTIPGQQGIATVPASGGTVETATCVASLTACLMPAPKGSSPWTTAWGRSPSTESASEYAGRFYADSTDGAAARAQARLAASGVSSIAKSTWALPNGEQADDELFSFSTANGAQSWYDHLVAGEDGTKFTVPHQENVVGFERTADSSGIAWTLMYGVSASTVMQMWVVDNNANDPTSATAWAATQMQVIANATSERAVPVALLLPTAPSYSGSGNGSTGCVGGSIDACLMAAPSGSIPRTGEAYYGEVGVSIQQYVDFNWDQQYQANEISILQRNGVDQIRHRDWFYADDSQADVSVLQCGTAAQAQAQSTAFSSPMTGRLFSIPGISSAQGETHSMNDDGDVEVYIVGNAGPYVVTLQYYSPSTANIGEAAQTFEQEFALLPAS